MIAMLTKTEILRAKPGSVDTEGRVFGRRGWIAQVSPQRFIAQTTTRMDGVKLTPDEAGAQFPNLARKAERAYAKAHAAVPAGVVKKAQAKARAARKAA
jgi:hypothetical protein